MAKCKHYVESFDCCAKTSEFIEGIPDLHSCNYTDSEEHNCRYFEEKPHFIEIPESGIGDLSDGYHTFNELYHHRAVLFSVICNLMPERAWKSKLHDTGDMFEGMFIVGIETPDGPATYHYYINPYWDTFKVKELERAPKWDGHTSADAINRIASLFGDFVEVVRCMDCVFWDTESKGLSDEHICKMHSYGVHSRYTIPNDYCSYGESRFRSDEK